MPVCVLDLSVLTYLAYRDLPVLEMGSEQRRLEDGIR